MDDLISRQAAIDAVNGLIDRFEQILRDIREANGDDSVCGMCEYDGAYIGQSGDWCNECPGFDKEDCFKLSDKCRKRWLKSVELPPAEVGTDLISRAKAIEALSTITMYKGSIPYDTAVMRIEQLPSAQTEIIRCKDCKYAEYIDDVKTLWCTECGRGRTVAPDDFCSYAERREVTT